MKLILITLTTIITVLISCNSQTNNQIPAVDNQKNNVINVSFAIDDSTVSIEGQCEVVFVNDKDSTQISIKNNEIVLPVISKDTGYSIIFKYGNYILSFKGITKKMILAGQDMQWKFGIDNRPFNNLLGLLTANELAKDSKTRQLQYLKFDPLEHGDGIQFVNKIE